MKTTTQVTKKVKMEINQGDLIKMLNLPKEAKNIDAFIRVPTGGDYSGMEVDMDTCPIYVTYTLEE